MFLGVMNYAFQIWKKLINLGWVCLIIGGYSGENFQGSPGCVHSIFIVWDCGVGGLQPIFF